MTAMSDALSPTVTDPLSADANRLETVQVENQQLREQVAKLEHQLKQLQRMIFGTRSERHVPDNPHQLSLGEAFTADEAQQPEPEKQTITYQRGKAKKVRPEDCVSDSGLRFDASVPVKTIELPASEIEGLGPDDYEVVDIKVTHRLATRPASYVVLRYERPVIKLRDRQALVTTAAPVGVIERSLADVSFLVGLLIDKFQYHMPLYRQHQRLEAAGITLSRATLTHLVHRTCQLLKPIVDAQLDHILLSRVLAMDETPIKAGKSKKRRGKMQQGYYWPLYGEDDEIVFTYAGSRARYVIEDLLNEAFTGVLLSDGYKAYASYVAKTDGLIHAQCWAHTRRQFFEARDDEPAAVDACLAQIKGLYKVEDEIRKQSLSGEAKRAHRLEHSKPIVDGLIEWAEDQQQRMALLPSAPFTKALNYLLNRRIELQVFLEDPDVAPDTNHVERALRPIPMGRKAWLFCWSEVGAEYVGVIQSLIATCKLHQVDPYVYLTDVLQRIDRHPNQQIIELTPRVWKEKFAANPLTSDLEIAA